jgi:hypothetical protein
MLKVFIEPSLSLVAGIAMELGGFSLAWPELEGSGTLSGTLSVTMSAPGVAAAIMVPRYLQQQHCLRSCVLTGCAPDIHLIEGLMPVRVPGLVTANPLEELRELAELALGRVVDIEDEDAVLRPVAEEQPLRVRSKHWRRHDC